MVRNDMRLPNRLTAAVGVAGLLCLLAAASAVAVEAKRVEVALGSTQIQPDLTRDFGTVMQGQPAVLVIKVRNQGDQEFNIGAVRSLCTCLSEESDKVIPPGQVGTISLLLETDGYAGPTTEAALIQWPDAAVGVTRVEMKMDIRPVLQVEPSALIRFRMIQGQASSQQVTLTSPNNEPFTVSSVDCESSHLTSSLEPVEGGGYRLTLTLAGDTPVGMLRETVLIHTDLETLPILSLKVTGVVLKKGR
jgi:hypothetical protein